MKNVRGNEEDTISVIIPFYTGAKWLGEAIESVLNQTLPPDEIIVVNDGSKENIDSLEKKYEGKVKFIFQENQGAGSARNHGMRISKGKYIAFLDSDDLWLDKKLEVQLNYMKDNNLVWSHCPYDVFDDETRRVIKRIDNYDTKGMMYPRLLASCKIATPCVMIKADCIASGLVFNEAMRHGQDYCFWNVLAKKYELGNVGESLVLVRDHKNNVAYNVLSQMRSKKQIYDYLINNKEYFGTLPFHINMIFLLCNYFYVLVSKVNSKQTQKVVAQFLYIVPWILFKIYYKSSCSLDGLLN